jgi:hypothetical protein
MVKHTAHNFPVGTFVESVPRDDVGGFARTSFIGTVVGITVNAFGEVILVLHMTRRSKLGEDLSYLGWKPSPHDLSGTIWEMTSSMHPSNVRALNADTYLKVEN